MQRSTDRVLIAGAGPVGATAALALAQRGVPVTVFEKRHERNTASKASTFHPPTIEIWDRLGVADEPLARGLKVRTIAFLDRDTGLAARFDLGVLSDQTRFPHRLHFEQPELTRVMLEKLATYPNAQIRFDHEVLGACTIGSHAVLRVRSAYGEHDERGAFAIGADGAWSAVRESLGIAFEGADYTHRVLRVMTPLDLTTLDPDYAPVSYIYAGDRSASLLAGRDNWRVVIRIADDVDDTRALSDAFIAEQVREFLPLGNRTLPVVFRDIYGASRRVATAYYAGRVALCGDAAHLTNTRGGMNMNCGIHDAIVLAQSVAAALVGADPIAKLAAYAADRRAVALDKLIPRSDRNVSAGHERLAEMCAIAADRERAHAYLMTTTMLDIAPRTSTSGERP